MEFPRAVPGVAIVVGALVAPLSQSGCSTRTWATVETPHLILHYEPGSYAARHLDEAGREYEEALEYALRQIPNARQRERKVDVYLYEDEGHGTAGHANRSDGSVHYWYSERVRLTSAHEFMHHLLYEMNPQMPLRFEEGVCRLYESRALTTPEGPSVQCTLWQLAKVSSPDRWKVLEIFQNSYRTDEEGNVACAFAQFLMKSMGVEHFWRFYQECTGDRLSESLRKFLSREVEEIDRAFAAFVKDLPDPPEAFRPKK